ncbi:LOW QUALITY PROTEIN: uncharacterized protein [Palaemon carinicauda]|uniref:LOW QUALITY PROTEIN: uncharacterized protein n=1 Tax=Palaemon carinicauda TaxID=392227 RepID=UPI0035B5A654
MLHLAAGVLDLQHKFYTETSDLKNDRDLESGDLFFHPNQGHPSMSNNVPVEMIETDQKPPGVDTEIAANLPKEENREECLLKEIAKEEEEEEILVEFSSSQTKEKSEKLDGEGKTQQVIKADIRPMRHMEIASTLVKGTAPSSSFHSENSPLLRDYPISLQDCSPVRRDVRSYSPYSQTSDMHSSTSTPSLEDSPTEVKEEPLFEGQRPVRCPRIPHNGQHESLMTDSGIYDHDLLDSDASDSVETGEDRLVETRSKVIDKTNGIEQSEGRRGRHACTSSEGALEIVSESEFYSEIVEASSPIKLKDDNQSSQQRSNSVDLSWYDSVTSDFYINSAFEGNVSGIAEFNPGKQGHYVPDSKATVGECRGPKSSGKKMVMLIEEPKRKENTDASFNTDEDELAAYIYDPQINDSYNTCLMKNREFLEDPYFELHRKIMKDREESGNILEDPLEDPNFALPSSHSPLHLPSDYDDEDDEFFMQVVPPFGDVTSKLNHHGLMDYKYEMHDATWGVSSGEVYFDLLTGQRILSTIYEFEVSSDEDTDSYRMTESRLSDVEEEEIRSFRKDSLEENPDLFSRDSVFVGDEGDGEEEEMEEEEEEDGCHTSQPVFKNVGDERDSLKEANESEKPSLSVDKGGMESIPRDRSVSDACADDDSPLIEEASPDISDTMECSSSDIDDRKSAENINDSDRRATSDKDERIFEHSGFDCEKEHETRDFIMKRDEISLELKENRGDLRGDRDSTPQLTKSCSDNVESNDVSNECEDSKIAQEIANDPATTNCTSEDALDISIVVTAADENYGSDEDFYSTDTFITTRDHYECNDSSTCVIGSDCCSGPAGSNDCCRNTLEVTCVHNTHISDDEAFQSDTETDVTYISNQDSHLTSNGHHDVANIAEVNLSDSEDEKNGSSQGNCPSDDSSIEKAKYTRNYDSVDCHVMKDDDDVASEPFDPEYSGSYDTSRVPYKDGDDCKSKYKDSSLEKGDTKAPIADDSNTEAEDFSFHQTEALVASINSVRSESIDVSSIEADALSDRHYEEFMTNNNVIGDHNCCCENGGSVQCTPCVNCEKEKLRMSVSESPIEGKIVSESCTEVNKTPCTEVNKTPCTEVNITPCTDVNKTPCTEINKTVISSSFTASIGKEKQPIIDSIQYKEEVAEDLRLPPGGVSRLVCVCCENLIGHDSLLGDSGSPFKDGESEESDGSDLKSRRKTPVRESSTYRTAALVAEECKRLNVNIGQKHKNQERASEEKCLGSFGKDQYLTGDEFEICVPELAPAKPKRLFLRRFSSENRTYVATPPLLNNPKSHPDGTDLAQSPIKPRRKRHSPMSPPRKIKKTHRSETVATKADMENGEKLEKEIERMSKENQNGENIAGRVDVQHLSAITSYSGSSSCSAETPGEARGERVGTGPNPRDPGSQQFELNTNSSGDGEIRSSHDAHETVAIESRIERATDDQGEVDRKGEDAVLTFSSPTKVSAIVASIVRESHLDSPLRARKLSRSNGNEDECIRDEAKPDASNNKDVCDISHYPTGGATECGDNIRDKPVTKDIGEGECHKTAVIDNSVLRDITNAQEKILGHSAVSAVDTNYPSIGNGIENKEVSCPRPPTRKKRSHSFNTIKESRRIQFATTITPPQEVEDQRSPPKVPPRTYRRCQSLPRRPKTLTGVTPPGRQPTSESRKAVGRSASTATCRPHSISDRTSILNSNRVPQGHLKTPKFVGIQGAPSNGVKLVSISPHTPSHGPVAVTEVSKNKKLSESFRRKSASMRKHYLSLPRHLARKFSSSSDANDDALSTCFPYLFSRKQKDIYDFTLPSSHPSEIPDPEPFARAPSTGSAESFSNLFSFYSSLEYYEQEDNRIENPFTKGIVGNLTTFSPGVVDKTPPQPPPRRNRRGSPVALNCPDTSVKIVKSEEGIAQTPSSVDMNDSAAMSQDLKVPLNSQNDIDKETPLCMVENENTLEADNTQETKLSCESSCTPDTSSPQSTDKGKGILNDSSVGILQEDFDAKPISSMECHEEEKEEERPSHETVENIKDILQKDEMVETHDVKEQENEITSLETAENIKDVLPKDELVETHDAPSAIAPSGDLEADGELHQVESETQKDETTSTTDDPEGVTPTDAPDAQEILERDRVPWTPPNVAFRTWAERQGVQEPQFTPLSLRRLNLERKGNEYGSLKERKIKSYLSMGQIDWNRGFSQMRRDSKGYQSLEDLRGKMFGSMDDISQDTPSPGPPVDPEKEENSQQEHNKSLKREEDTRVQQDRCIEVYPETVRQRQRNMMTSANKVDIKNWTSSGNDTLTSPSKVKKFLPSVKALRNQFETGKTNNRADTNGNGTPNGNLSRKSSISNSSVASSSIEKTSSTNSLSSANGSVENLHSSNIENSRHVDPDEPVEPIYSQFKKVDEELRELMSKPPSTTGWNPRSLLKRLYYVPEAPKHHSQGTTYINIEGYLEKLPSGRKKATFWNAWKRRYFVAKDGVLYYYQNPQADKASMKMTLMGGKVECMEPNMVGVDDGSRDSKAGAMIGIDDGKGHYVVVRCSSKQEAERWRRALETHTVEDFASQYVQPWPIPTNPTMLRDTLIIDLGSSSVRAGVLASQATLPQVFLPSVVATERESRRQIWGFDALSPDVRSVSSISFPIRPSHKISKYSVDLSAVSSLLQKAFADLKVDPKNYNVQLSVPRVLNPNTQAELLRVLFDKYGVKSVNLTHQSILALYAYNATSGIVVDIGERLDIVPVIDGYIVDGGVSRVPYGGYRILDHLRQFLYMRNISLINEVESYIIRYVLENICYCAHHYNTEKARCTNNPDNYEKGVSLAEYFQKDCSFESISLDFGRFQATEGLFNPDAWGLDHPGIHKLVHKAIMECSMDIRKEMSRSIFLAGGVTQLPGLVERLTTEIDNLTPPAIRPKVHASPYRYHAAYIGACVLAESPAFTQSRITREDWNKHGNAALKKWSL